MPKKIQHDYVCEECGKPATWNEEDVTKVFKVLPEDDFEKVTEDFIDGSSHFYCDDCYSR